MSTEGKFAPRTAPVEVRFWSRVERRGEDECWPWLGSLSRHGYGHYTTRDFPTQAAHRIAFLLVRGAIDQGLVLDHLCRTRECVNPWHLDPVTSGENSRRSPLVVKDECANGHPFTEGSYYLDRGSRACKKCKRQRVAEYVARTGRTTATFVCEFCGETRNLTSRAKHIRLQHPENYAPRAASEGLTPERKARRLAQQRARRRAAAEARRASA